MYLAVGTTLGNYEVTGLLGSGGMGEVYRALDTKLKREVAIKVLPENVSCDPERIRRFQREAQVLASLNHPNIAHVYGLEETGQTRCIVMELVEGDTLADHLKREPIPFDDAIRIVKEIAEALEAAHGKTIVHRDLKPANIKLTPEGRVKVLDFGLAKIFGVNEEDLNLSDSPTVLSQTGGDAVLGTAAYMSPEQARGKVVDSRSDVWSFGCVLYEMFSGKKAFSAETVSDTIVSVLSRESSKQQMNFVLNWSEELKRIVPLTTKE